MDDGSDGDLDTLKGDDKIIAEARKRFRRCEEWESEFRALFVEDLKFAEADSDNGWQWPADLKGLRSGADEPCLTINRTRQHNLQIINDAKQNKPGVNIRPSGGGATFKAAQIMEGIVRHIEYQSSAEHVYDTATEFQVKGGIGYIRVVTDYLGEDTFDQEIYIRRVKDPLSIYLDPDINEVDGSDARFGFVFTDMPRDQFEAEYPELKDDVGKDAIGHSAGWIAEGHVRKAEYYRKVEKKDQLIVLIDKDGNKDIVRKSKVPKEVLDAAMADQQAPPQTRDIITEVVEWYTIAGNKIADFRELPGKYIPIVRVIGEETIIEGKLDRKGHTRSMKDPQRMYNYMSSAAVQFGALQTKTPYKAPSAAIEGFETYWNAANRSSVAVLPYNHMGDDGQPIPAPMREQPPTFAPAFVQGMKTAQEEMMMASGQYEVEFGQQGNERSGKAINARQRQGDNATYHFIDGLGIAIQFLGKILIDLIPKIYDTPRIVLIMGEDGKEKEVQIDPSQSGQAYREEKKDEDAIQLIFNPNVGRYSVQADIGPAYATKRQEAWNAFVEITSQNKELVTIVGDLMFQNADFPGADEIAERLKRLVPAHVKGDGPPPELQAALGQVEQSKKIIAELIDRLGKASKEKDDKSIDQIVDVYGAETARLAAVAKAAPIDPASMKALIHQLVGESLMTHLNGGEPPPAPALTPQAPDMAAMMGGQGGAPAMGAPA